MKLTLSETQLMHKFSYAKSVTFDYPPRFQSQWLTRNGCRLKDNRLFFLLHFWTYVGISVDLCRFINVCVHRAM